MHAKGIADKGFFQLDNWWVEEGIRKLGLAAYAVFSVLKKFQGQKINSYPSLLKITLRTGLKERAIRNALRALEAEKLVLTEHRPGRESFYFIPLKPPREMPAEPGQNDHKPSNKVGKIGNDTPAPRCRGTPAPRCRGTGTQMPGSLKPPLRDEKDSPTNKQAEGGGGEKGDALQTPAQAAELLARGVSEPMSTRIAAEVPAGLVRVAIEAWDGQRKRGELVGPGLLVNYCLKPLPNGFKEIGDEWSPPFDLGQGGQASAPPPPPSVPSIEERRRRTIETRARAAEDASKSLPFAEIARRLTASSTNPDKTRNGSTKGEESGRGGSQRQQSQ